MMPCSSWEILDRLSSAEDWILNEGFHVLISTGPEERKEEPKRRRRSSLPFLSSKISKMLEFYRILMHLAARAQGIQGQQTALRHLSDRCTSVF